MIQRIQSLYLILVALISNGLIFIMNLWTIDGNDYITIKGLLTSVDFFQIVLAIMFLATGVLSLISLFLFKNRLLQIRINRVNIIVNLILFGLLIFNLLNLSGEFQHSLKGIGIWLPLGLIVLLFLANRAIQKDENLVKSVDRIR